MGNAAKRAKRMRGPGRPARVPIGAVVRSALADDVLRLLSHEPGARRSWPEHVHQMRTSVRRLRSDLRFFGPALREEAARPLRDELRWLAGVLGAARDLDVLEHRLREAVVAMGLVSPSDPLFEEIDRRRDAAQEALSEALDGDRYAELRAAIIAEGRAPSVGDGADRPAGPSLADRLSAARRRFLEGLDATPADAETAALHEFRKRAKRTRYAAESAAEWLGGREGRLARRLARRARDVQEILGESQDACVAAAFIRDVMAGLPDAGPARAAADALLDRQRADAEEARDRYHALRDRLLHD